MRRFKAKPIKLAWDHSSSTTPNGAAVIFRISVERLDQPAIKMYNTGIGARIYTVPFENQGNYRIGVQAVDTVSKTEAETVWSDDFEWGFSLDPITNLVLSQDE